MQVRFPTLDTRTHMPYYHAYVWLSCALITAVALAHGHYGIVNYGRKSLT